MINSYKIIPVVAEENRVVKRSLDLWTSNFMFEFVLFFSPSIFESKHH